MSLDLPQSTTRDLDQSISVKRSATADGDCGELQEGRGRSEALAIGLEAGFVQAACLRYQAVLGTVSRT